MYVLPSSPLPFYLYYIVLSRPWDEIWVDDG